MTDKLGVPQLWSFLTILGGSPRLRTRPSCSTSFNRRSSVILEGQLCLTESWSAFLYTELDCTELSCGRNCIFLQFGCHESFFDSSLLSDIWRCSLVSHCIGYRWNDSSILPPRMRFRFYFRVSACILLLGQVYYHRKMYRSGHIFSL